jgi:hypothetical protein
MKPPQQSREVLKSLGSGLAIGRGRERVRADTAGLLADQEQETKLA